MYDCADSCNKCSGKTKLTASSTESYKTECKNCGFRDYWDTGHFESSSEMVGMCDQYYYENGIKRITKRATNSDN